MDPYLISSSILGKRFGNALRVGRFGRRVSRGLRTRAKNWSRRRIRRSRGRASSSFVVVLLGSCLCDMFLIFLDKRAFVSQF